MFIATLAGTALVGALGLSPFGSDAMAQADKRVVLRVGDQGDAISMDPHSLNESLQLSFTGNIYEGLMGHAKDLSLVPALATEWKQVEPTVWRFKLRQNVKFHDGTPFTAEDVIFSLKRSAAEGSDMKSYSNAIAELKKVDDHTVDIVTKEPFPILPNVIQQVYIMSKAWCEANNAVNPVDKRKGVENAATSKAIGTGPYKLKSREAGVRTVLERNTDYWNKADVGNVDEVVFTPISQPATRVAALKSGELDFIEPVPIQDIQQLQGDKNIKLMQGPELRTIFLGMDQKRDELLFSNVKGKNPFKDRRVRQAFYQALDMEAIKQKIMRGASTPTALMAAPGIKGFSQDLNKRTPYDPKKAKELLTQAGYPDGFEVKMNCPNDRYVNDGPICQAIVGMLARIGVKVNLEAESKGTYFPKILSRNTSFYMLGWTPSTYDSHNVLVSILASPGDAGQGLYNLGSYSNPKVDELTKQVAVETDMSKRDRLIHEAYRIHAEDYGHIPLHQQALAWGMRSNITAAQLADGFMYYKWFNKK